MTHKTNDSVTTDETREGVLRNVILSRRSTRAFTDKEICEKDLLKIVEAGIYAPSGSNSQNQRFLVIKDKDEIRRIGSVRHVFPYKRSDTKTSARDIKPSGIIGIASALIFVFSDAALTNERNNGEYYIWEILEIQNGAASIQNMLLTATAKGIGNCWISCSEGMNYSRLINDLNWKKVLSKYRIPCSYKIQGLVILGYPKLLDEKGYPKGEQRHGVAWKPVQRKDISHYLINKNTTNTQEGKIGFSKKSRLLLLRKVIKTLLFFVNRLDKFIYKAEHSK